VKQTLIQRAKLNYPVNRFGIDYFAITNIGRPNMSHEERHLRLRTLEHRRNNAGLDRIKLIQHVLEIIRNYFARFVSSIDYNGKDTRRHPCKNSVCKGYYHCYVAIIPRPLPQSHVHSKTQATRGHAVKNAWLRF